jgi:hypothetical protein
MDATADQLLAELENACRAEVSARAAVREASARVGLTVRALRRCGVPSARQAHRVAKSLGLPIDLVSRRKLASRFRQRASRTATAGHDFDGVVSGLGAVPMALPSPRWGEGQGGGPSN